MSDPVKVDIKQNIDWMIIGEKVTSYKDPLSVEKIGEYNGFITVYTKQLSGLGKQLAFEKESFLKAIGEIEKE
jgi:hypothetical protein